MTVCWSAWPKRWVEWIEGDTAFLSVPFTWLLPKVSMRASALRQEGYRVRAGGPAVALLPDRLPAFVERGGEVSALHRFNPDATVTSRGCNRQCSFCAVYRVEGGLRELKTWEPRPIVCDNNLLACSQRHFDRVIDSLKGIEAVDFNQGLDARLLRHYHADRIAELQMAVVRLAWDSVADEVPVMDAIGRLRRVGFGLHRIRVYCLIGHEDTPDDALYRLETLRGMGIRPNPQRFNPLDTMRKNSYVPPGWTEHELGAYMHYWSRLRWFEHIPFTDFCYQGVPAVGFPG